MKVRFRWMTFLLAWLMASGVFAEEFSGRVLKVVDGDTLQVLQSGKAIPIRLNGVDCPEIGQGLSSLAKKRAAELVSGKNVKVRTYEKDRYGRIIADILLENGRTISQELIRLGYCRRSRDYSKRE